MKKRIMAFFLSMCMIASMLAQYVPGVSAKEIDPWENPEAYVGNVATFNTDDHTSFHIFDNPAAYDWETCSGAEEYYLENNDDPAMDELPDDSLQLMIKDYVETEVLEYGTDLSRYVWFEVEAAEGYELPEEMADKPYVLYTSTFEREAGDAPLLKIDPVEEVEEADPLDDADSNTDAADTTDATDAVDDTEILEQEELEQMEDPADDGIEPLYVVPEGMIDPWENPGAYVGSIATFNAVGEESLSSFHVVGDPESYDYATQWEDDAYWLYNEYSDEGLDELPNDYMQMEIIGYYDHVVEISSVDDELNIFADEGEDTSSVRFVWYQVKPLVESELPEKMADKSYVLYMTAEDYDWGFPASLSFDLIEEPTDDGRPELAEGYEFEDIQLKGYFSEEVVKFYKTPEGTARTENVNTAELPAFVDVLWKVTDTRLSRPEVWYIMKPDETWPGMGTWEFCYVPISHVTLVPAEVTDLYEALLGTATLDEYDELIENADSELVDQLTEKHFAALQEHYNAMMEAETRTVAGSTAIGTVSVPVEVTGILPAGATVSVEPVSNDSVMAGGFDIENEDEIVLALDIKVLDENGEEWQPKEGRQITVAIGMEELGYEDGKIFRLHHKHGEDIDVYEVFVVMDGKLTVRTNGFSTYLVSAFGDTRIESNAVQVQPGGTITLTVGKPVVYYANPTTAGFNAGNANARGTWQVTDKSGAIFYEVYTSGGAGTQGCYAPWIKVVPLKETTGDVEVTLRFVYGRMTGNFWEPGFANSGTETYDLNIVHPMPDDEDIDGKKLYIVDNVNEQGVITAMLTDEFGNKTALDDKSKYSWKRSDGAYIVPGAYKGAGNSIDICVDHGGLIQRRAADPDDPDKKEPTYITYEVTVTLPNGLQKTADYTVYYQSEIINSNFENPPATEGNYTFFVNGWPNLYWKTTSPGEAGRLTRDIEYANYQPGGNYISGDVNFFPNAAADGTQFAELNAETFGALYQDIITAPGETVEWQFYHSRRNTAVNGEAMYLIMGPTEYAQEITTYAELDDLIDYVIAGTTNGVANTTVLGNGGMVKRTYNGAEYTVWYHNADDDAVYNKDLYDEDVYAEDWAFIKGEYEAPTGQYRTRLFFVSDPNVNVENRVYGNLIDSSVAGQYKSYLIEYYEESYATGERVVTHRVEYDQAGSALIYSAVELESYDYFIETEHDYLSQITINGENYPYNIKYPGVASLFIEKYSTDLKPTGISPTSGKNYDEYDIVMRIYLRDTVVAVQKWVEFPTVTVDGETEEALTPLQKQGIIDKLVDTNGVKGYYSQFHLECRNAECDSRYDTQTIHITKNDPLGWYTGFIPIGENPRGDHTFSLTEKSIPALPGLELDKVSFTYFYYLNGERMEDQVRVETYEDVEIKKVTTDGVTTSELVAKDSNGSEGPVILNGITLDEDIKIAEIQVKNIYKEKTVTINYEAVGNGTVKLQDGTSLPADKATETFRYYSGNPKGAVATPDTKYTFAGWYLDKECTIPVGENHGYVNKTGEFKPNKDLTVSDDQLVVTYYAKFSIGSLQIIRENAEPGQVFVYEIKDENNSVVMYATVVVGEDGKGSTEIVNASFGKDQNIGLDYTITQLNDWSWRHNDNSITQRHKVTDGLHGAKDMTTEFVFKKDSINDYWLNGNSAVEVNRYNNVGGSN